MSGERFSLDTNVLVYAVDSLAGAKQQIALDVIGRAARRDCHLTIQALSEFFVAATRKGIAPKAEVAELIEGWLQVFPVLGHTAGAARIALAQAVSGALSYWDALLVATVVEGGCAVLISEDMADSATVSGVTIVNPFGDNGLSLAAERLLSDG
jgi:predicted nucleic acid-binding protein